MQHPYLKFTRLDRHRIIVVTESFFDPFLDIFILWPFLRSFRNGILNLCSCLGSVCWFKISWKSRTVVLESMILIVFILFGWANPICMICIATWSRIINASFPIVWDVLTNTFICVSVFILLVRADWVRTNVVCARYEHRHHALFFILHLLSHRRGLTKI